jgi:N-acetylglucosaminyldiphosphoundecaprenol N-acetyl-beta-D-mannosaminyltransferase
LPALGGRKRTSPHSTMNRTNGQRISEIDVLGTPLAAINLGQAVEIIEDYLRPGVGGHRHINIVNVYSVVEARKNARLRDSHNRAFFCTPDGVPLVWFGKMNGHKKMGRVYGPDLMEEIMKISSSKGYSHYFYGGSEGTPELLRERWLSQYPELKIVGTYSPPFRKMMDAEEKEIIRKISDARPDILWVGLGCPKQEIWMAEHVGLLDAKLMIGVGAAFDFHAGLVRQAPSFLQRMGLEWAFRMLVEPRRLWRRYLSTNPLFLYLIFKQSLNKGAVKAHHGGGEDGASR